MAWTNNHQDATSPPYHEQKVANAKEGVRQAIKAISDLVVDQPDLCATHYPKYYGDVLRRSLFELMTIENNLQLQE